MYIVEVVIAVEKFCGIVSRTEVFYAAGSFVAVVLTTYVIRHEVHDHIHAALMCTLYQCLEFLDALVDILGYIGIYVIVVSDGVWRPCLALDDVGIVARYAVACVVGSMGMLYDACVPYCGHSQLLDGAEHGGSYVVHLARSVL